MKRGRQDGDHHVEAMDVVNCLMLLSKVGRNDVAAGKYLPVDRVFTCKTCSRQFPSFQALGGHRASHKKPKLMVGDVLNHELPSSPVKPKTHECSICGLEFAIGQALGGHMRRHRRAMEGHVEHHQPFPVLKKSSSSKRVMCLDLDLNLAPPGSNDHLKLQLMAPVL
ncbi:hypothetical protein FNV43_RR04267 [Rhamnella rubrinervis]|uniref:C2H2-type domain-containing protein n=1 Tax=Rhamnella rubrinervis TaxID=2594499 RepID=A0A8K0HJ90_9ROSA|nr:hypothetical protein FNV43_RR04267 [Rhamnella rubrinervis]